MNKVCVGFRRSEKIKLQLLFYSTCFGLFSAALKINAPTSFCLKIPKRNWKFPSLSLHILHMYCFEFKLFIFFTFFYLSHVKCALNFNFKFFHLYSFGPWSRGIFYPFFSFFPAQNRKSSSPNKMAAAPVGNAQRA